jgi:hypothetical protein
MLMTEKLLMSFSASRQVQGLPDSLSPKMGEFGLRRKSQAVP